MQVSQSAETTHARSWKDRVRALRVARFGPFVIVALTLIIMMPRLRAPYFGLIDDGTLLDLASKVLHGDLARPFTIGQQTGRFFPVYWYFFAFQYALWGLWPLGFYLVNCLVLCLTALALSRIVRLLSGSAAAGFAAGVFYLIAPPLIENYYTVAKSEIQLTFYLVLLVLCLLEAATRTSWRVLFFVLSVILLLCGLLTKETSLMLIPISVCWAAGYAWLYWGNSAARPPLRMLLSYIVAAIICAIVVRGVARLSGVASTSVGSYSQNYQLSARVMVNSMVGQLNLLARDYGALIWLLVVLALAMIYGRNRPGMRRLWLTLGAAVVWVGPLLGVFWPWQPSVQEYYLLPASLGICAALGVGVTMALRLWAECRTIARHPALVYGVLLLCALGTAAMLGGSLINMQSNGRLQIAIDRQNNAMLDALALNTSQGGLVLFNVPDQHGYPIQSSALLSLTKQRTDVRVGYFSSTTLLTLADGDLIATFHVRNPPVPSVRVAGASAALDRWNSELSVVAGTPLASIYSEIEHFPVTTVYTHQWLCPLTRWLNRGGALFSAGRLCQQTALIHNDTMEYGWTVYRAQPPAPSVAGRGLIGVFRSQTGTWLLRDAASNPPKEQTIVFGAPGDIPLAGDWSGQGVQGIGVYRPATQEWLLSDDLDGTPEHTFAWDAMQQGDIPLAGDWDGDGKDTIGFFRPRDVSWHLRNSSSAGSEDIPVFQFGMPTDIPVAGDWDGDGVATIGIYRPTTGALALRNRLDSDKQGDITYKLAARILPVVTSWNAHALDTVSSFVGGTWQIRYSACQCVAPDPLSPITVTFGQEGDIPVAGDWNRQ